MMVTQTASAPHYEPILTMEHISDTRDVLLQSRSRRHQLERRAGLDRISHSPVPLPDTLLGILKVVRVEKRITRQRQNIPSRRVHDDHQATLGLRFLHACGEFLL